MLEQLLNVNDSELCFFNSGYIAGTIVVIAVFILIRLIFIFIRRNKKAGGVKVATKYGSLFIATHAISDLVHSMERDFPSLKIAKVYLYENKKLYFSLEINVTFHMQEEGLPNIVTELQQSVLDKLENVFGIANVKTINVTTTKANLT